MVLCKHPYKVRSIIQGAQALSMYSSSSQLVTLLILAKVWHKIRAWLAQFAEEYKPSPH